MTSVALMLLTDSRFPAGGYAHSGGLEPAVTDGLTLAEAPAFLRGRLRGIAAPEAYLAVAAAHAARDHNLLELLLLDHEAAARCPSPILRRTATRLGSQLLRTANEVWPARKLIGDYRERSDTTPRPVVFGLVAALAGLDARETAHAYLYEDAASVTAAAVKLLPIDGASSARWLVETAPLIDSLAGEAAAASSDSKLLPGGFGPALELNSLRHAAQEGRLFAS
jgi:urease accessory protein